MPEILPNKKTYIAVALAFISALALYAQGVVTHGFDLSEFLKFLQTEAVVSAIGFLRFAFEKK